MRAINLIHDLNDGSLRADSLDNLFHREGLELRLRCCRGETPELLPAGSLLVATLKADLDGDAGVVLAEWELPADYKGYYGGLMVLSSDVLDPLFVAAEVRSKTLYFQISHRPTVEDHPSFSQMLEWVVWKPVVQPDDAPPLVLNPDPYDLLDVRYVRRMQINAQTGTAYTPVLEDDGKLVTLDNGAAVTVTVPADDTTAFPSGAEIAFAALGAGVVSFEAAEGVTIRSTALSIADQYAGASLVKLAADEWLLVGALS